MENTVNDTSPYREVHAALSAIEPGARALPPGTQGIVSRTLLFLRARGDGDAVKRLETIALLLEALWHCARSGDEKIRADSHGALARLRDEWIAEAPILPEAAQAAPAAREPVIA